MISFRNSLLVLLLFSSVPTYTQTKSKIVKFDDGIEKTQIPVTIFDNVVYLPVSVNGNPPLDFVLDTGAPDLSIIETEVAEEFARSTKQGGNLKGAGSNKVAFKMLDKVTLSLPGMKISGARVGSFSLKHMEPYWGKPKFGLIGGNILKELVTEINYANGLITFHDWDKFVYTGNGRRIPILIKDNAILIEAAVRVGKGNKVIKGTYLVDTAVRNSFFTSPFNKRNKVIEQTDKTIENITGFGIGGESYGIQGRIYSIDIAGYELNKPVIEFSTDTKGVGASTEFDGMIGADLLSRFNIIIDYKRKEMILEPNRNFKNTFDYDMSGLYLIADEANKPLFKIANVVKDSPAFKAGIKKNDVIVEIDDVPAGKFSYEEIKNYLKGKVRDVKLKIARDKKTFNLEFITGEIL